jgi:hypothetical protein
LLFWSGTMTGDEDFLQHLYDIALGMYKYAHTDVWRGQKYYTTLNAAIISIGFGLITALVKLSPFPKTSFLAATPIFGMGFIVSLFAYFSIKALRRFFLEAIWYKTFIEQALNDKLDKVAQNTKVQESGRKWRLTPVYSLPDKDREELLTCKESWIRSHILRKGGITWYFVMLQILFMIINILGIFFALCFCYV